MPCQSPDVISAGTLKIGSGRGRLVFFKRGGPDLLLSLPTAILLCGDHKKSAAQLLLSPPARWFSGNPARPGSLSRVQWSAGTRRERRAPFAVKACNPI